MGRRFFRRCFFWLIMLYGGYIYQHEVTEAIMPNSTYPDPSAPPAQEALGQSESFLRFSERLSRAAKVDRPILIIGERGTGKELAAYRLHYLSSRWQEPFVTLNCAALSPSLIESELFGHEAGAFTGALRRRIGRFEAAHQGTLFLDEIGAIPLEAQEKILRVVEYGSFERVGSSAPVRVDVRIIGATNADLPDLADQGKFKSDLLDRLSFEVLFIPPLREREGDALYLANHFAVRMAHELGRSDPPELGEKAMVALEEYDWPGNVRELKNVIERAVYASESPLINDIVFDPFHRNEAAPNERPPHSPDPAPRHAATPAVSLKKPLHDQVADLERALIKRALTQAKHNQRQAASLLGLTYHQFRGLYRKYGQDGLE